MKIYAYAEVCALMGDGFGISVEESNIDTVQAALDMDPDNTLKVRVGMFIERNESGQITVYDNSFGGYSTGGTNVLAIIR